MNSAEAKAYLKKIGEYERRIRQIDHEIGLVVVDNALPSVNMDGERVQTSRGKGAVESAAIRIMELTEKFEAQKQRCQARRMMIVDEIWSMKNDTYKTLLYSRYAEGKRFEKIADEMGYSHNYILKLHGKALIAFGMVMEGERRGRPS